MSKAVELDWFHLTDLDRMLFQANRSEGEPFLVVPSFPRCSDSGVSEEAELVFGALFFAERDSQNGQGPNSNRTKPCTKFFR